MSHAKILVVSSRKYPVAKICNDPREARISVEKRLAAGRRTDQIRGERKAGEHGWLLRGTGKPALVLNYCAII